jgi:hypothetical protein
MILLSVDVRNQAIRGEDWCPELRLPRFLAWRDDPFGVRAAANQDIPDVSVLKCKTREIAKDSASAMVARGPRWGHHAPCLPPPAAAPTTTGCVTSSARNASRACFDTLGLHVPPRPAGFGGALDPWSPPTSSPWMVPSSKLRFSPFDAEYDSSSPWSAWPSSSSGSLAANDQPERRLDDRNQRGPGRASTGWNSRPMSSPAIAVSAIARRRFCVIVYTGHPEVRCGEGKRAVETTTHSMYQCLAFHLSFAYAGSFTA